MKRPNKRGTPYTTYFPVGYLIDLQVGKVYIKDGRAYLIKENDVDRLVYSADGKDVECLLTSKEHQEYIDNVKANRLEHIWFKMETR